MAFRESLKDWVVDALAELGGEAEINAIARQIWLTHETDLKGAGDYFYSWQYDIRGQHSGSATKDVLGLKNRCSKCLGS